MGSQVVFSSGDLIEFPNLKGDPTYAEGKPLRGIIIGFYVKYNERHDEYITVAEVYAGAKNCGLSVKDENSGVKQTEIEVGKQEELMRVEVDYLIENAKVIREGNSLSEMTNFFINQEEEENDK